MMGFPNRETVEHIRRTYPAGCRVVLDEMDDVHAPRIGSQGTVTGVDDTGSVMCAWDEAVACRWCTALTAATGSLPRLRPK